MLELLCPDDCVDKVMDIDLKQLYRRGIRGLILDVDNTLLGWESDELPTQVSAWVQKAKQLGFRVCIASNGTKTRVRKIAEDLDVPAISKAVKPRKRPFRRALKILGTTPQSTAVIGDQIFTDVLGGNRMDLYTILINPVSKTELRTTKIVRRVERRVLTRLHRKGRLGDGKLEKRLGG